MNEVTTPNIKWTNDDGSSLTSEEISHNISEIKRMQLPKHANLYSTQVNAKLKKEDMI